MAISKTFLDVARVVPQRPEKGWGAQITSLLVDFIDSIGFFVYRVGSIFGLKAESETSTLASLATLTATAPVMKVQGTPGAITLAGITAGEKDGQLLEIIGLSDANTVTLLHAGNVSLNGDMVFGLRDSLFLRWDEAQIAWIDAGRSN